MAALALIDQLDRQVAELERELRTRGADHPYVSLLQSVPGVAWVLGYTIASEIGDIARFPAPAKLCGYTGLCPRVRQSGASDRRGPLTKAGPRYLRWALLEAAASASRHPVYSERPFTNCATGAKAPITKSAHRGRDREMSPAQTPNQLQPP